TGSGPGRYTVYSSYDGGQTWDHLGISLKDSGWCRPAAAPKSKYVYAMCTNDTGKLYSYVSADDGHTWRRYDVPGGYPAKRDDGSRVPRGAWRLPDLDLRQPRPVPRQLDACDDADQRPGRRRDR